MDFKEPYNRTNFLAFLAGLLPDFESRQEELQLNKRFLYIEAVTKLGQSKKLEVGIYEINHTGEKDPRVSLTREAFSLMKEFAVRKSLIIFKNPESTNYRLSLITFQSRWETGSKIKTELSNPKRLSFFLGPESKTHTPEQFLIKKGEVEDFEDLLSRFNVEVVTKEFFNQYRRLFENVNSILRKDFLFKRFAESSDIDVESFAKKLLGQLVFIYFVQRKGWLGAKRGMAVNEGDKNFLRNLFTKCVIEKANFYNRYLEPLFYKAFGKKPLGGDLYREDFGCQIPFLNGGLFEPLNNYNWEKKFIHIPNEIFSNVIEPKGEEGILDIFDLYNFTVYEDDPIDKEVSIDPEMLGKVFENMIEENLRKGKGTYYTPREIVHYMCKESLKNYLETRLRGVVKKHDIEILLNSDGIDMQDQIVIDELKGKEHRNTFRLPPSIRQNAKLLDDKLKNIRVCDPAVGSGAFLVGMMTEIVKARRHIDELLSGKKRNTYSLKRNCIENCLYGVDIDRGAIEIARLRLWLSLIVDDEDRIEPLPNLDYKVMVGNSLIEYLSSDLLRISKDKGRDNLINKYSEEKRTLTTLSDSYKKQLKRQEINLLIEQIVNYDKREKTKDVLLKKGSLAHETIERFLDKSEKMSPNSQVSETDHFEWHLNFNEVFRGKRGFDVVIANPPYIDSESMVKKEPKVREAILRTYRFTKGNWDIYIAFFELAFKILNKDGVLTFITPDKWISKPFGDELRKQTIKKIYAIVKAGRNIFESAKVDSIMSFFSKIDSSKIKIIDFQDGEFVLKRDVDKELIKPPFALDYLFSDNLGLLLKIESVSGRILDLGVCENACATSDAYKLSRLIKNLAGAFNKTSQLKIINTGTIGKYFSKWGKQEMTYLGHKYLFPIVQKDEFFELFKNSYSSKSVQKKVIVKGLNLLDACLDLDADVIPGKSTLIITSNNINHLKAILLIINSKLAFFYIKERYPASSYNQGTSFTKEMINSFPFPILDTQTTELFSTTADKILAITESDNYFENSDAHNRIDEYQNQVNQLIYKLYGLIPEEIKIVEKS